MRRIGEKGPSLDAPIIIVGAGPVGLALAADLGWMGVPTLIVDQGAGGVPQPKTSGVNMRTMEFCRRWGLAEKIRSKGLARDFKRDRIWITSLTGYEIARKEDPSLADDVAPRGAIETFMRIHQTEFDPILRDFILSRPSIAALYHTRCTAVEQDADGVTVTLTDVDSGAAETVRAKYLVSCEGAGSLIRKALGVRLEGNWEVNNSTNAYFRSSQFLNLHDKGEGLIYGIVQPDGYRGYIFAINGTDLWQAQIRGLGNEKPTSSPDEVAAIIRQFVGRDFEFELLSVMPWTRRQLLADHYQKGRVFLAGDAIHQMPPSGTLGMNTGVADATNLSWKLAAMLAGWGGKSLLDTYESERRPIADYNAKASTRLFHSTQVKVPPGPAILENTPEGERARAQLGAQLLRSEVSGSTEGLQIGYCYEDSPICWPGKEAAWTGSNVYQPTTRPGARAPDAWIKEGDALLDHFGRGFVLVRLGKEVPETKELEAAAAACRVPLTVLDISNRDIEELYERRLVLVRPDGHVAWRGDDPPSNPRALMDTIRGARSPAMALATSAPDGDDATG
jgi:2-polyprenyl-6-methoxyphenol hydroxylase-like FAD-dependent oxidoreductase